MLLLLIRSITISVVHKKYVLGIYLTPKIAYNNESSGKYENARIHKTPVLYKRIIIGSIRSDLIPHKRINEHVKALENKKTFFFYE